MGGTGRYDVTVARDQIRAYLQFGLRSNQRWVEAIELERALDLERRAVELSMGQLERECEWLQREERAGELRWRLPQGLATDTTNI